MGKYSKVHEVKHDHKWVNVAKKEGLSQDYLIDTFVGICWYAGGYTWPTAR